MLRTRISPQGLLLLSFALLIFSGGFALWLPYAGSGQPIRFIDALFTSTSAVCVTGLTVIDTATRYSRLGQTTILILIQLGGLGILTLSTFFLVLMGKKISLGQKEIISTTHAPLPWVDRYALLKKIVFFTLIIEGSGALLLFLSWLPDYSAPEALFHSVFHAVSAFCNSGFSTFSTSLASYRGHFVVNVVVMVLVVAGGLGFVVIVEVENYFRFHRQRFSLHSKLVLITTAALILLGALGFFVLEYTNVLRSMTWGEKILVSFFQSITPRTAGFNTVDYALLTNPALLLTIVLMFFGGAPGSTAGGVKVTTLSLLSTLAWSRLQGKPHLNMFNRTVPQKNINEAMTLFTIAVFLISTVVLGLQISELGMQEASVARGKFLDLNFEAVSAFGTVGLSTGITPTLTDAGKILIMLLMYVGRLGPLTLVLYISQRSHRASYQFYEEEVVIG